MATAYKVLAQTGEDGVWRELDGESLHTSTDQQAIREATKGLSATERSGTFVAVPVRSWRPRSRTIETKEVDRWT